MDDYFMYKSRSGSKWHFRMVNTDIAACGILHVTFRKGRVKLTKRVDPKQMCRKCRALLVADRLLGDKK